MNAGDFDFDLQNFIYEVIQNAIPKGKKGIKRLISASKLQDIWKEKCSTPSLQICYLARYGLCYTSAVNWYFTHFIKLYTPIVIPNAIVKRQLRLCCLGSGPPLELVAISGIISTWQYSNGFRDSRPLVLHVTVLSRRSEWNQMNQTILKALLKNTSLLDTAGTVIRFELRQCDYSLPLNQRVHKTISSADIVTIARAPRKGSSPDKRALMLQAVMQLMKPHSILFHLGFSGGEYFKLIQKFVSSYDNMQQIYGPYQNESYFVTSQCSGYYELVYENTKIEIPCLTSCNVTVAAWMKLDSTTVSCPVSIGNPDHSSPTYSQTVRRIMSRERLRKPQLQGSKNVGDFDSDLQTFIREVLVNGIPKERNFITRLISASKIHDFYNVCFKTAILRYCYLARYGLCYTSAVNKHFTNLIKLNKPVIIQNAIVKRQLSLCCLGSGQPLELVAIYKIISAYQYSSGFLDSRPLELYVTVIAQRRTWKSQDLLILQSLQENTSFFDTGGMDIRFRFIPNDFSLPLTRDVHETITSADILTIVRAPRTGKSPKTRAVMLQTVMQLMKPDSILFHLGFSKGRYFNLIKKCVSSFDNMQQIYGSYKNELCFVTSQCSGHYELVYEKTKIELPCLTSCNVTVAAWMKLYSTPVTSPVTMGNPYNSTPTCSQTVREWVLSLLGFDTSSGLESTLSCRTPGEISHGVKRKIIMLSPNQTKPVLQDAGIVLFINVLVHSSKINSKCHVSKSSFNKEGKEKLLQRVQNGLEKYQDCDNLEIAEKMENHRKCKGKTLKDDYYQGVSHFLFPTKSKQERILVTEWKRQKATAKLACKSLR